MTEIVMPKFGLTMTEGLITAWHRKPGDVVKAGELLFEVETEKVTNEVEASADGVLEEIFSPEGSVVAVGLPIARMADGNRGQQVLGKSAFAAVDAPSARKLMAENGISRGDVSATGRDGRVMKADVLRIIATPLARRIAREDGIDLAQVIGSGPQGRIKAVDVQSAKSAEPAAPPSQGLIQPDTVRAATAHRVQAAKRDIPHFYLTRHVDTRAFTRLRNDLNAQAAGRVKLSMTHLLVKAAALAISAHPALNRVWLPDGILALESIGVGVVTETPQGLRIPVVDRADTTPLDELADNCARLFDRARRGALTSADVSGGAISISNVGMIGAHTLTPIINPPQAMMLGVGAELQLFRPDADGRPELRQEIVLTLAADHRIIDGADAARFVTTMAQLLEEPLALLRQPARADNLY
jgi:pyruvate dehydrogenase E2 component (dihydrolipoamide acetyltransferase)